jgi:hypothetical protein
MPRALAVELVAEARRLDQRISAVADQDKTLITHARTQAAKFLGYEITVLHNDRKITHGRRTINGTISLRVPESVIKAKKAPTPRAVNPSAGPI